MPPLRHLGMSFSSHAAVDPGDRKRQTRNRISQSYPCTMTDSNRLEGVRPNDARFASHQSIEVGGLFQ